MFKISYSPRVLSFLIMAYMLVAFAWWAVLLQRKNKELLEAQIQLVHLDHGMKGGDMTKSEMEKTKAYQTLIEKNSRQHWMILGEGAVFSFTLLIGIWLIHRGYRKEMEASRQQRNFLLSITHELKSPIASIKLILETIRKRALSEEQSNRLTSGGLKEVNRLSLLVNDLLLSARLESSYHPDLEVLDMHGLLSRLVGEFQLSHPDMEIILETGQFPAMVKADRQGLLTVFSNLLENALKYNFQPEKKVWINTEKRDGQIKILIADNGSGISAEEKKRVFQKFYRSGNEDTRQTKGTGLGLYIVKEIIEAHFGTIFISDNQPKGVIFTITLNLEQNSVLYEGV